MAQRGASQYVLALELLSSARHRLRGHPAYGLCEAGEPANALLHRIRAYGWYGVCRLKKHRRVNGQAGRPPRRPPDWAAMGWWHGGLKVRVVRYGKKDSATQRLSLSAAAGRRGSRLRSQIAEVMRVCQDQRG